VVSDHLRRPQLFVRQLDWAGARPSGRRGCAAAVPYRHRATRSATRSTGSAKPRPTGAGISGAMMIQATLPSGIGIRFNPLRSTPALLLAGIATAADRLLPALATPHAPPHPRPTYPGRRLLRRLRRETGTPALTSTESRRAAPRNGSLTRFIDIGDGTATQAVCNAASTGQAVAQAHARPAGRAQRSPRWHRTLAYGVVTSSGPVLSRWVRSTRISPSTAHSRPRPPSTGRVAAPSVRSPTRANCQEIVHDYVPVASPLVERQNDPPLPDRRGSNATRLLA
jgi:hypothetical protein